MSLCDHNCVILQTNRARCTSYRRIFDLLDEESISERAVVGLVESEQAERAKRTHCCNFIDFCVCI